MLTYVLPILIAYQGGKIVGGDRGALMGGNCHNRCYLWNRVHNVYGSHDYGTSRRTCYQKFDKAVDGHIPAGFEMIVNNFSVGILD